MGIVKKILNDLSERTDNRFTDEQLIQWIEKMVSVTQAEPQFVCQVLTIVLQSVLTDRGFFFTLRSVNQITERYVSITSSCHQTEESFPRKGLVIKQALRELNMCHLIHELGSQASAWYFHQQGDVCKLDLVSRGFDPLMNESLILHMHEGCLTEQENGK